jgi:hypothetical protein
MPYHVPLADPLPDDANYLHTSRDPINVDMQNSMEDSQGISPSSRATLDILLYGDTNIYIQEPPMPQSPSPVSEQLPISMDGQELIPISPGEVELWIHDDLCAPPAAKSNPVLAGYTRPSSPSLPDSPATSVHRRITLEGRYKVPLPSPIEDDTAPV